MDHVPGTIYLLHFDRPYKHARHNLGWARDLNSRLAEHQRGTARLLPVVSDAGIGWQLARTRDGDRYPERQLKNQGGRSRMCPACKHPITGEASVNTITPAGQPEGDGVIRADLTADLTAARQARSAVRRALASWAWTTRSATPSCSPPNSPPTPPDMPAARSASRSTAMPRPTASAASPARSPTSHRPPPRQRQAGPDEERGRGLSIVTALADASGVRAEADGKTTWFTLALGERIDRATRQVEPEAEAGA